MSSKTLRLDPGSPADLARAAQFLREVQTVAFPTETVYGLGANALDPAAVARIFEAKQRPTWDPLIVHVADSAMLARVADLSALPAAAQQQAQRLIARFWPGPLTLLLPRTVSIPDAVTAGRPLVGVRMPAHPIALALISAAGIPIAAPSANRFGHTSPTTARHVLDDLDGRIAAVLDGGPTEVGLESTVIGFERDDEFGDWVSIYRPGAITASMLDAELGAGCAQIYRPEPSRGLPIESLPSPGVGIRHYAPKARLVLVPVAAKDRTPIELSLVNAIDQAFDQGQIIGVMLPEHWNSSCANLTFAWGPWGDGELLAQRLFAGLRSLDESGATTIICPEPEMDGIGAALRDRLEKAARTE